MVKVYTFKHLCGIFCLSDTLIIQRIIAPPLQDIRFVQLGLTVPYHADHRLNSFFDIVTASFIRFDYIRKGNILVAEFHGIRLLFQMYRILRTVMQTGIA